MTSAAGSRYVQAARSVTRGGFIALGLSIPISVWADNALVIVIVLSWLLAGRWSDTLKIVRSNAVAAVACVWVLVHVAGALYSIGEPADIARALRKASTFLLIPIALAVMNDPRDRDRAFKAFLAGIALTVVLSTVRWLGFIPVQVSWLKPAFESPSVVFKFHLTQNLLVAFGAFVFAVESVRATTPRQRWLLALSAAACAINVDFIGDGRTGQGILFILIVYFGAWLAGRRGILIAFAAATAFTAIAYVTPGSSLHKRSMVVMDETAKWQSGERPRDADQGDAPPPSSTGVRLQFYQNSVPLIAQHPVAGVGSGGFPRAYAKQVEGTGMGATRNPHSEYLLQMVELGLIGLALTLGVFWVCWRTAPRLPRTSDTAIARGATIAIGVASIANSSLTDHTETLMFVWAAGVAFAGLRSDSA